MALLEAERRLEAENFWLFKTYRRKAGPVLKVEYLEHELDELKYKQYTGDLRAVLKTLIRLTRESPGYDDDKTWAEDGGKKIEPDIYRHLQTIRSGVERIDYWIREQTKEAERQQTVLKGAVQDNNLEREVVCRSNIRGYLRNIRVLQRWKSELTGQGALTQIMEGLHRRMTRLEAGFGLGV